MHMHRGQFVLDDMRGKKNLIIDVKFISERKRYSHTDAKFAAAPRAGIY